MLQLLELVTDPAGILWKSTELSRFFLHLWCLWLLCSLSLCSHCGLPVVLQKPFGARCGCFNRFIKTFIDPSTVEANFRICILTLKQVNSACSYRCWRLQQTPSTGHNRRGFECWHTAAGWRCCLSKMLELCPQRSYHSSSQPPHRYHPERWSDAVEQINKPDSTFINL